MPTHLSIGRRHERHSPRPLFSYQMINKETLNFLKGLDKNNNRKWFQAHKKAFDAAQDNPVLRRPVYSNALTNAAPSPFNIDLMR